MNTAQTQLQAIQTQGDPTLTPLDQAQLILKLINDLDQLQRRVDAQTQQIEYLTAQVSPTSRRRQRSMPPANVAPMHPVEELVDEALLLNELSGSDTTFGSIEEYLQRPRVRPEDIELSAEDSRRARQPRGMTSINRKISAKFKLREHQLAGAGRGGEAWSPTAIVLLIALVVVTIVIKMILL